MFKDPLAPKNCAIVHGRSIQIQNFRHGGYSKQFLQLSRIFSCPGIASVGCATFLPRASLPVESRREHSNAKV